MFSTADEQFSAQLNIILQCKIKKKDYCFGEQTVGACCTSQCGYTACNSFLTNVTGIT